MRKNNQQQRKQAPPADQKAPVTEVTLEETHEIQRTTPLDQAIEQDRLAMTTIKVTAENRDKIDALKIELEQQDYNGVITALIDGHPGKKSTREEVTLVMSRQKLDWILAFQSNSDCSATLKASVR